MAEATQEPKRTLFGMTHAEHLNSVYNWMNDNRHRLHSEGCISRTPSAQCDCGLHSAMTDLSAVINDIANPA